MTGFVILCAECGKDTDLCRCGEPASTAEIDARMKPTGLWAWFYAIWFYIVCSIGLAWLCWIFG